ncbi:MAG: DUF433 domain-containing protein [Chloroflexota bacterium]
MKQLRITVKTRQQLGQIFYLLTEYNLLPEPSAIEGIVEELFVWVEPDTLVEQIVEQLTDYDFVTEIEVCPLWPANGRYNSKIKIIETGFAPIISASRVSVYDVMIDHDDGDSPQQIGDTYNLSPHQVEVALDYIEEHRDILAPQLKEILIKKAENEKYHRAIAEERRKQIPIDHSPRGRKLRALIEESRQKSAVQFDANYPQRP